MAQLAALILWSRTKSETLTVRQGRPQTRVAPRALIRRRKGGRTHTLSPAMAAAAAAGRTFCGHPRVGYKDWFGCDGLEVNDEMKVTIAGQACLLVLGIDYEYHYDQIRSVLVYPDTYLHPPRGGDFLHEEDRAVYGEAWHRGPIVLSWKNTRGIAGEVGANLVFQEFAHHLDDLDGDMDGTPPLERGRLRRWERVVDEEYCRLVRGSRQGRATLSNQYGASSRAEFFAVATECFFERPLAMEEQHAELYAILRDFYRQDPRQSLRHPQPKLPIRPSPSSRDPTGRRYRSSRSRLRRPTSPVSPTLPRWRSARREKGRRRCAASSCTNRGRFLGSVNCAALAGRVSPPT